MRYNSNSRFTLSRALAPRRSVWYRSSAMKSVHPRALKLLTVLVCLAAGLWYVIFALSWGNFWGKLTVSASILAVTAAAVSREDLADIMRMHYRDIAIGLLSAAALYLVFGAGRFILVWMFPAAEHGIENVYGLKAQLWGKAVGVGLLCLTGVAEEVFWRGYVQRTLTTYLKPAPGLVLTVVLYAGVHVWTLNGPLILAAAVAGLFWGVHFMIVKTLPSVIISHAVWSCTVFLFLPLA